MKTNYYLKLSAIVFFLFLSELSIAQGIPELLYYKFNGTGTSVANQASKPPTGAAVATIMGKQKQTANGTCNGTGLLGTGDTSNVDYVDTKYVTNLSGSWTISLWTNGTDSVTNFYLFGDVTAPSYAFRCIANGIAFAGNAMLRGTGMVDLKVTGGIGAGPSVITFVYDSVNAISHAYLDGKLNNSVKQPNPIILKGSVPFKVGGYSSFTGLVAGGVIDEFRWYTRALSANEISRLRYLGNSSRTINLSFCDASGFKSPSGKYNWTTSGTYFDTIANYYNCDSLLTYNLTFLKSSASNITRVACEKFISPSGKTTWTSSGIYMDVLKNAAGCDSNISVNLTINKNTYYTMSIQDCDSHRSVSGKYVWKNSGTFSDTIKNYKGCDSIITTNLTMFYSKPVTLQRKECNSYLSPSGKHIWTASGTYLDTVANKLCSDSVITVELTIVKNSSSSYSAVNCYNYKSPYSNKNWSVSGVYADTIRNVAGCDSSISVNLTINNSSSATMSKTACDQFESPSKKYVWTTSGTYSDTIKNANGCDSFMTINLTVNSVNVFVTHSHNNLTAVATGAQYQWLDCKTGFSPISGKTNQLFTATVNGDYAVAVTEKGCTDTSSCYSITTAGLWDYSLRDGLKIYPNPTNGIVNFQSEKSFNQATIRVVSLTGEVLDVQNNIDGVIATADLSEKAAGIYFIEVLEQAKVVRFRVIKY